MDKKVPPIPGIDKVSLHLGITKEADINHILSLSEDFVKDLDSIMIDEQVEQRYGWATAMSIVKHRSDYKGVFVHSNYYLPADRMRYMVSETAALHPKYLSVDLSSPEVALRAAVEGLNLSNEKTKDRGLEQTKLIGTALEPWVSEEDCWAEHGRSPKEWIAARAELAMEMEFDGIMAPGVDAHILREIGVTTIIASGNRMADTPHFEGDEDCRLGNPAYVDADVYVVGRPLTRATDPTKVAEQFGKAITDPVAFATEMPRL